MEHYVTLFDSLFLPQGLALHFSLKRHGGDFTLWVLCVDRAAYDVLTKLNLENVRLISLEQVETDDLRQVKPGRSRGEYCWTLTSHCPRFVFDADPKVQRVTYLDADMWLLRSPRRIFAEFEASGKAVLITEHAYAPEYDLTATTGRYCVQFVTFCRDRGEPVRQWWAERCIEWCFARIEDGRYGDQKYLDDWAERFETFVHVLQQRDLLVAPWNACRFPYGSAVLYHFHNLRLLKDGKAMLSRGYEIPKATRLGVYEPYLVDLSAAIAALENVGHRALPQMKRPGLGIRAGVTFRKLARLFARLRPIVIRRLPVAEHLKAAAQQTKG